MPIAERLRQMVAQEERRLRAAVPGDREAAILAVLRVRDRAPFSAGGEQVPDLVTGRRIADLGGNKALGYCLAPVGEPGAPPAASPDGWAGWAERFLRECGRLVEAELVLAHVESGFMRVVEDEAGTLHAWIATKRPPTSWRERADFDWWAGWLARRREPDLRALLEGRSPPGRADDGEEEFSRRSAGVHVAAMAHQFGYPPEAELGGCTVRSYVDVLRWLVAWALRARDRGEDATTHSEREFIAAVSSALTLRPDVAARAVAGFTLEADGAAYHAAVPGVAAAPLVRVGPDRLVPSIHGVLSEPLLFLARELRRRDPQGYHNSAYLREAVFRRDLYGLFADKRFVTSAGRLEVKRDGGGIRTDIDAAVFDRKSGTLGVFELKSQEPFARSNAELERQRDTVLYANRQVSGVLAWLQRHGGDALLTRIDARAAKTFRVQKVYPFVLGRYLANFDGGPEPDRRAAWGTWPQVLRLIDAQPLDATANPLASLHARLTSAVPSWKHPSDGPPHEIGVGDARLVVYPSLTQLRAIASAGQMWDDDAGQAGGRNR